MASRADRSSLDRYSRTACFLLLLLLLAYDIAEKRGHDVCS
jgi:hypothetical protein